MPIRVITFAIGTAVGGALVGASFYWSKRPSSRQQALVVSPATTAIVDPNEIFKYGSPLSPVDIGNRKVFISLYDRRMRNPTWVAELLTAKSLEQNNGDRKNSEFHEDHDIPQNFRAKLSDYSRSGYDRGHLGLSLRLAVLISSDWAHFEDFCRRLTSQYQTVRIITGPLYLPKREEDGKWRVSYEVIGTPPNVAVPTHFYKIIMADKDEDGQVAVAAFVMPNSTTLIPETTPLGNFQVPLEAVERDIEWNSDALTFSEQLE